MRKIWLSVLMAALLLMLGLMPALADGNLLENPDFEALDSQGLPLGWDTDAYLSAEGYTTYAVQTDEQQGNCAVITNFGANDARFAQTVYVEPDTTYRLSGYILASGIEEDGWGANLSVSGVYLTVDSWFDTEGEWQYT